MARTFPRGSNSAPLGSREPSGTSSAPGASLEALLLEGARRAARRASGARSSSAASRVGWLLRRRAARRGGLVGAPCPSALLLLASAHAAGDMASQRASAAPLWRRTRTPGLGARPVASPGLLPIRHRRIAAGRERILGIELDGVAREREGRGAPRQRRWSARTLRPAHESVKKRREGDHARVRVAASARTTDRLPCLRSRESAWRVQVAALASRHRWRPDSGGKGQRRGVETVRGRSARARLHLCPAPPSRSLSKPRADERIARAGRLAAREARDREIGAGPRRGVAGTIARAQVGRERRARGHGAGARARERQRGARAGTNPGKRARHGVNRSRSMAIEKARKASRRRDASMRSGVPSRAATIS